MIFNKQPVAFCHGLFLEVYEANFMRKLFKFLIPILVFSLLFSSCAKDNSSKITDESDVSEENESYDVSSEESSEDVSAESTIQSGEFFILYTEEEVDFSKAPKAEINKYPWGDEYTPYAYGQVIFKKDDGFYVFMYCEEKNPRAEIKENGGSVYTDSCLEFFCDYRPQTEGRRKNYINLEMNSLGVYLANYRSQPVDTLSNSRMTVKGEVFENYWTVTAHIPLDMIMDVYGEFELGEGSYVKCNFTKCGSGTEIPHYGSWRMLKGDTPNFHQPDCFKRVQIRKPKK